MVSRKAIFSSVMLFSLICFIFFPLETLAADGKQSKAISAVENIKNPNGSIIGVSSKGSWGEYPENSIEAVGRAADTGIDFILVDIKRSSDGVLIAFSDDTTERMLCADKNMNIAETDYKTLSAFKLKKGCGGSAAPESFSRIPTLRELILLAKEKDAALMLRCSADILPDAAALLYAENAVDRNAVIISGSAESIKTALAECPENLCAAGTVKSNIIFSVRSFVKSLEEINAAGAELKSSNRYGINYQKSVLGAYTGKLRLIADTSVPDECGARQDNENWWDNLISLGYSVIITDYPEIFSQYAQRTQAARERLEDLLNNVVSNNILPDFKNKYLNDYKKAYDDAVNNAKSLLKDGSSPVSELNSAFSALNKAVNDINKNYASLENGSAGTTFTAPRIALCVCAAAAVISVQIFFWKRRKKNG